MYSTHKNAMLEMLAHDLGGPLGIVQQLAVRLEKKIRQAGQEELAHQASLIHRTVSESIHLIHDLIEQEYLESSQTPFTFQRVELIEQLKALLGGYQRLDQDGHKHFALQSSAPSVFVEIDQTKFLQAIQNLVTNANKFTPDGGHITVQVAEHAGRVLLSVKDDGIGIPADLQPHLFERFTKARRPGLKGEKTVGLGLSIVKRTVELHQGKIWVESKESEGTTFFIDIPIGQSAGKHAS
jgi:two-component system sensor histidine kinase VicK